MTIVDLSKMKELRNQNGLTLLEMSKALGYESPNGYHYLEQGIRHIKADQLPMIAEKLGVEITDLFSTAA